MLNAATLAAGEVTAGDAAKSRETLGATVSPLHACIDGTGRTVRGRGIPHMTPSVAIETTAQAPEPIERRPMVEPVDVVPLVTMEREYTRFAINSKEGPGRFPFGIDRGLLQTLSDHWVAASGISACATPS